jgi:general secretion pathway protein E
MLIGEMRDRESMSIAIEAALTGHLVLSSLHAHSTVEAITRLRHADIEPFLIASALRGLVSQRLVPKLCADCREESEPAPAVRARMERAGLAEPGETVRTWVARGCPRCRNSGVRGRIGVYEALSIAPPLQAAIENGATAGDLLSAAPPGAHVPLTRYARHVLDAGLAGAEPLCGLFSATAGSISTR